MFDGSNFWFAYFDQTLLMQFDSSFIRIFKMDGKASMAMLAVLNELVDSEDEKITRGKTRKWVTRRRQNGFYNNTVQKLKMEDRFGFKRCFGWTF